MKRKLMMGLIAAFVVLPLVAAVQSTGSDANGASSFDTGAIFGGSPHPTSGNAYEVVSKNLIRTPSINGNNLTTATNIVFRGDSLSLGNASTTALASSGQIAFKSYYTDDSKRVTVTIDDFRLYDFAYVNDASSNAKTRLAGGVSVYASSDNPAQFAASDNGIFEIASTVSGAATAGIKFPKANSGQEFRMSGDMSQYLGSVTADDFDFRLVLACPYAAGSTSLRSKNKLTLGPNFSYVGTGTMSIPAGTRFVAAYDAGTGTTIPVVLDSTHFTLALDSGSFEIALDASSLPAAADYAGKKLPVVKIPSALLEVSEADFTDVTSEAPVEGGLPLRSILVETDGEGMQTVYLETRQYIKVAAATENSGSSQSGGYWYLDDGATWSDGASPSNTKDYLVQLNPKSDLRARGADYVFPGNSLTLDEGKKLALKGASLTVSNFTMVAGSILNSAISGAPVVDGTMRFLDTSSSKPALVYVTKSNGIELRSTLLGDGFMKFHPQTSSSSSLMYVKISGDNSEFIGTLIAARENYSSCGVAFESPRNLGGPLGAFRYDALTVGARCALEPTSPMTLDTANRGIYFSGYGTIAVTNGTFGIMQKIRMAAEITKTGSGVLALGGEVSFGANGTANPNGSNNALNVVEGGILPLTTNAFARLAVTLGDGARLVADAAATDDGVREFGLLNNYGFTLPSDGKLRVAITGIGDDYRDYSVVLCTIPATQSLSGNIVVDKIKRRSAEIVSEELTIGGVAMIRYTATVKTTGICIIFK